MKRINEVWASYKDNKYFLTPKNSADFYLELKAYQKELDKYIEKYLITKLCSRCQGVFPATSNYFYKDRRVSDGLRPDCIQCHRTIQKENYKKEQNNLLDKTYNLLIFHSFFSFIRIHTLKLYG